MSPHIDHEPDDSPPECPQEGVIFSWAFYLFGMVITAPVFTFLALRAMAPKETKSLLAFSIDPMLVFGKLPILGAFLGFVLVLLSNVAYAIWRKRTPRVDDRV